MITAVESPDVSPKRFVSPRHQARRRTLLVVSADEDCLSRNLVHAVGLEFPWLDVTLVSDPTAACNRFDQPLALVLVDMSLLDELRAHAAEIARRHPGALLALLQPGDHVVPGIEDVLACPQIRSVLPMNLKLDVWLATVRLILLGGEYMPFALLRSAATGLGPAARLVEAKRPALPAPGTPGFRDLTTREAQILEFVARGLQNKVIASTLGLSEHTVKIHLHNIIRKLCVHNRTEAARFYLDCVGAAGRPERETAPAARR